MEVSPNHESLITQIEQIDELALRFKDIRCVNVSDDRRRGVMSLVFRAKDRVLDCDVAIKFMDPDRLSDSYDIQAFEREPKLISKIEHKKRCVSLVSDLDVFNWELQIPGNLKPVKIPIKYFSTCWLENDIDSMFLEQDQKKPIEKLKIFRLIILAIEAIHSEKVSHRDLKPDNFRATEIDSKKVVMAIDFGRSAHIDSPNIASQYNKTVGANAYSPPESFLGFPRERKLGPLADVYSLGCLLFELFNIDLFAKSREASGRFGHALLIMSNEMSKHSAIEDKIEAWGQKAQELRNIVTPPSINGPGNTVPPAISNLLESLYFSMVNFDFTSRASNLEKIRCRIDTAIKVLESDKQQKFILQRKKRLREAKLEKLRIQEERLNTYLVNRE